MTSQENQLIENRYKTLTFNYSNEDFDIKSCIQGVKHHDHLQLLISGENQSQISLIGQFLSDQIHLKGLIITIKKYTLLELNQIQDLFNSFKFLTHLKELKVEIQEQRYPIVETFNELLNCIPTQSQLETLELIIPVWSYWTSEIQKKKNEYELVQKELPNVQSLKELKLNVTINKQHLQNLNSFLDSINKLVPLTSLVLEVNDIIRGLPSKPDDAFHIWSLKNLRNLQKLQIMSGHNHKLEDLIEELRCIQTLVHLKIQIKVVDNQTQLKKLFNVIFSMRHLQELEIELIPQIPGILISIGEEVIEGLILKRFRLTVNKNFYLVHLSTSKRILQEQEIQKIYSWISQILESQMNRLKCFPNGKMSGLSQKNLHLRVLKLLKKM